MSEVIARIEQILWENGYSIHIEYRYDDGQIRATAHSYQEMVYFGANGNHVNVIIGDRNNNQVCDIVGGLASNRMPVQVSTTRERNGVSNIKNLNKENILYITSFDSEPAYRGKGFGYIILVYYIEIMRHRYPRIQYAVLEDMSKYAVNTEKNIYAKVGFSATGNVIPNSELTEYRGSRDGWKQLLVSTFDGRNDLLININKYAAGIQQGPSTGGKRRKKKSARKRKTQRKKTHRRKK